MSMSREEFFLVEAKYDPNYISQFYDQYGEREWVRFERSPVHTVNYHLHLWYLQQYVKQGDAVLEVGAGPGRFTIELAKLGTSITVGDISPGQLESNGERVQEAGYEAAVIGREVMDIVDLSHLPLESFDAGSAMEGRSAMSLNALTMPLKSYYG